MNDTPETDAVLSAIRRGEDTLPKMKAATGIDYSRLHLVLYKLEFEWNSVENYEDANGAAHYYPRGQERTTQRTEIAQPSRPQPIASDKKETKMPKFNFSVGAEVRRIIEGLKEGAETDTPRISQAVMSRHQIPPEEEATLRTYISQSTKPLIGKMLSVVSQGVAGKPTLFRRVGQNGNGAPATKPEKSKSESVSTPPRRTDTDPLSTLLEQLRLERDAYNTAINALEIVQGIRPAVGK